MSRIKAGPGEVRNLRARLANHPKHGEWLTYLENLEAPTFPFQFPDPGTMGGILNDLAVPHEDIDAVIAMTPDPERDPEVWWVIERAASSLNAYMGQIDGPMHFPVLAEEGDVFLHYYAVYIFLALREAAIACNQARGIPDQITRRTLQDLGRNMAVHRKRYGIGGLGTTWWPMYHFRGAIFQLGRLQFQRARLGNTTGTAMQEAGTGFGPADYTLSVHINDFGGPFGPQACDDSFAQARDFFSTYFPEEPYKTAVLHSWLMDPQLEDYLPETSNIVQFRSRFTLNPTSLYLNDDSTFQFVFGKTTAVADILPRETTLQRAMLDHLAAGGHWYGGSGWMLLPDEFPRFGQP